MVNLKKILYRIRGFKLIRLHVEDKLSSLIGNKKEGVIFIYGYYLAIIYKNSVRYLKLKIHRIYSYGETISRLKMHGHYLLDPNLRIFGEDFYTSWKMILDVKEISAEKIPEFVMEKLQDRVMVELI